VQCAMHAEMEERHTVRTKYLTDRGADGPMQFYIITESCVA
jgi:hypothetical protein